jgi:ATP-binding cassette subfamily F protein uup
VLDEPTNDLDLETLELLEEQLVEWPGTLLLVSHDRSFLDNVVTSTFVLEGDGRVREYVGGYEDWVRQRLAENTSKPAAGGAVKGAAREGPQEKPKTTKIVARRMKLSFKDQRELDALPAAIDALEQEQKAVAERIAGPDFYKESAETIRRTLARAEELQRELATAYARWGDLDARK